MSTWTDERMEQLRQLWTEGHSAATIAGMLGNGITKNAVIGKIHRLKINTAGGQRQSRPKTERVRKPSTPRTISTARRATVKLAARSVSMIAAGSEYREQPETFVLPETTHFGSGAIKYLTESTCKWPVGDPLQPDFRFCGGPSADGSPYCTHHHARAYHPADGRRSKVSMRLSA
jgi:Uncharacterized protein conserved in bacteria